ncbi:WxcM-like domain-containing protein [bacterium LRH843]|nr:WxcM-like domain-containing protein [bacterium LRH843]
MSSMKNVHVLPFPIFQDERGCLIALESNKSIPFELKRIYYHFGNIDKKPRGFHAHKQLHQVLICLNGSCKIKVANGMEKDEFILDSPMKGLYIGPMIWREIEYGTNDSVLLALVSDYYDESDYIRDYEKFLANCKKLRDKV